MPGINVQQAVNAAVAHVNTFPDLMPTANVRLEEFEYDEQIDEWKITLSFAEMGQTLVGTPRNFKTFLIDGTNGHVKSMKIRSPFAART